MEGDLLRPRSEDYARQVAANFVNRAEAGHVCRRDRRRRLNGRGGRGDGGNNH
jgi:hypothetical protein